MNTDLISYDRPTPERLKEIINQSATLFANTHVTHELLSEINYLKSELHAAQTIQQHLLDEKDNLERVVYDFITAIKAI